MQAPTHVSFKAALLYWLKLGFISFGGPAGQISIMHDDLVERRRWISEGRFLHALNYCMLLPGPEAQQLATYIGWLLHGTKGGILAGMLFILPSLFLLIALTWTYLVFGNVPMVAGIFYGLKPAVTAIVLFAAYRIGKRALKNALLWAIAAAAFAAIFVFDVPFPAIIFSAAFIGYLAGRISPALFTTGNDHSKAGNNHSPALIDDHTVLPEHTHFKKSRALRFAAMGAALWIGVMALLFTRYGWHGTLTQMGWFFTKAALLTFGGAYAVLPYVHQGAVEHYQWLTTAQMIDGLALGETTPGPLIMVVTFVGFVGAWTKQLFGPDALVLAGIAGGMVATLFTFLPSFLFILVGAPLIEATRHTVKFTAPLTAITAAVVGVILNLALFFAYHVFWPQGFGASFAWFSALLSALAFIALIHYRVGVVPVIIACGTLGLLYSLVV
ncbi:MAG TPA: chromate efflux transporter [Gammaproteobacteria bacterium]|nr:chromate efflux transporter [Gammaproteobacteria bacterium]